MMLYAVVIESYDHEDDDIPFYTEIGGIFKSYRDASEWIVNEGFNVEIIQYLKTYEYDLHFEIPRQLELSYWRAYIEEHSVK